MGLPFLFLYRPNRRVNYGPNSQLPLYQFVKLKLIECTDIHLYKNNDFDHVYHLGYFIFIKSFFVYYFSQVLPPPLFSNFLFTNLFSIKFLYFFIISSLFPYFNLFVSIFIIVYIYRVDTCNLMLT
jgi:hypothetical protein